MIDDRHPLYLLTLCSLALPGRQPLAANEPGRPQPPHRKGDAAAADVVARQLTIPACA